MTKTFEVPLQQASVEIYQKKYQLHDSAGNPVDANIEETQERVAQALANIEKKDVRKKWKDQFLWALKMGAIPAGRIIGNAGAEKHKPATSTINCTVSGNIDDSMDGIMSKLHQSALTLKAGCGIGYCFSTLRPKGAYVAGASASTSGPLTFMDIYDKMCLTISSAGGRRGAQMGTFSISHPDVLDFIKAKREDGRLRQFNLSCLITKSFMNAVKNDSLWQLVFPANTLELDPDNAEIEIVYRDWPVENSNYKTNKKGEVACRVYKTVKAKDLWDAIMESTYAFAEPGFILIDRVNEMNNNWFCENIHATNPCVTGNAILTVKVNNTPPQNMMMKDVVIEFNQGVNIDVLAYDDKLHKTGYYPITWADLTRRDAKIMRISTHAQSLSLTEDHLVWNHRDSDYIEAGKLNSKHCLLTISDDGTGKRIKTVVETDIKINKNIPSLEDVYDISVKDVHNFFANKILVHNCGEQPLPPFGSCLLGSVNLTKFVKNPFSSEASFDWDLFNQVVKIFTRMLDNVVEINRLPLPEQQYEIHYKRRHGMGYLGLGSAMTMLGMKYGDQNSISFTSKVSKQMAKTGFEVGLELAKEKGPAPIMEDDFTITPHLMNLRPQMKKDGIKVGDKVKGKVLWAKYSNYMQQFANSEDQTDQELVHNLELEGCRFTHHTSIAPTGTISLSLANNASNGIEPSFAHHYTRNVIVEGKKTKQTLDVFSFELLAYRKIINSSAMPNVNSEILEAPNALPDYFINSNDVTPEQHINIQAAAQIWIDSSISKTANVPTDFPFEDFKDIYMQAFEAGLKGCTTFRFNPEHFQGVLVTKEDLANTTYKFTLEDGSEINVKGNETIEYDGETHTAANLFDALKEGTYGSF